jgi:hypothetical protein
MWWLLLQSQKDKISMPEVEIIGIDPLTGNRLRSNR